MYAEPRLFFPYMQSVSQDFQQLEEYCKSNKPNYSMSNIAPTSDISDYDLEGDLFKAPERIIEEPLGSLDPMTSIISMSSCGEDVITSQDLKVANLESIHSEQLLSEVFNDWDKDLMEKAAVDASFSDVIDIKIPVTFTDENNNQENKVLPDVHFQKSVSSGCLTSMHCVHGTAMKPSFLDLTGMDFRSDFGIRRAFSEGDIKTLDNNNMSLIQSPLEQPSMIGSCLTEGRKEKLSRYRNKKTKRNFGRRIKYACRKALADSQPRIRGRFAKTDESDVSTKQQLQAN